MPATPPNTIADKERDAESGLDYFGARYYGSNMGRWMSPDWSAKAEPVPYAKLDNPQTLNLYAYVGNNPLSRTDPTGHYVCSGSKDQCAAIQTGLNLAKAAQDKLGADSKGGKAIGAVLKFYGAAGEKNGVGVSFGNLAKGTLGETSISKGGVNIKFDLGQINSFSRGQMAGTFLTERSAINSTKAPMEWTRKRWATIRRTDMRRCKPRGMHIETSPMSIKVWESIHSSICGRRVGARPMRNRTAMQL